MAFYKMDKLIKNVNNNRSDLAIQRLNSDFLKIQYFDHPVDWHTDNRDEFFICLDGEVEFEFNDQKYIMRKGDMVVIEAGIVHKASSSGSVLLSVEPHEESR